MSHTFRMDQGTTAIYNSDCSGFCVLRYKDEEISVPCQDLLQFAAEHIRQEKISQLEKLTFKEILGSK